jgi:hypothetical protein
MKKKTTVPALGRLCRGALAALFAAALVTCSLDSAPSGRGPAGTGVVTIRVGDTARTLRPADPADWTKYEITVTPDGQDPWAPAVISGAGLAAFEESGKDFALAAGDYTITVDAYRQFTTDSGPDEVLAAQGSSGSFTVTEGGEDTRTISVSPLQTGDTKGEFAFSVTLPGDLASASLTLTTAADAAVADGAFNLLTSQSGSVRAAVGNYNLDLVLTKADGLLYGEHWAVQIYSHIPTTLGSGAAPYDLSEARFFPIPAPTTVAPTKAKSAATAVEVAFTLSSGAWPYGTSTWPVYTDADCSENTAGVTASVTGTTLTLRHESDVPVGTYYVKAAQAGAVASTPLALSVVAPQTKYYLKFDGNLDNEFAGQGSLLVRNADGTLASPDFVTGKFGEAALHLSPGQYLDLGNGAYYGAGQDFTVAMWAKMNSADTKPLSSAGSDVYPLAYVTSRTANSAVWQMLARNDDQFAFGTTSQSYMTSGADGKDKWVCVVLYFSSAENNAIIYVGNETTSLAATTLSGDSNRAINVSGTLDVGNLYLGNYPAASGGMTYDSTSKGMDWYIQNFFIVPGRVELSDIYAGSADPAVSDTPKISTADTRHSLPLAVTNAPAYLADQTTWKVYDAPAGGNDITASAFASVIYNNGVLTLTSANPGVIPYASPYYLTATELGKAESARFCLTLTSNTAAPVASQVVIPKASASAAAVNVSLSNPEDYESPVFKVYSQKEGGTELSEIAASYIEPVVTLTHGSDIPAGTYWIAAQNTGLAESTGRLPVTVTAYGQGFILPLSADCSNAVPGGATVTAVGTPTYGGAEGASLTYQNYLNLGKTFDYSGSFTFAMWVKINSATSSDPAIFSNKRWNSGGSSVRGYVMYYQSSTLRSRWNATADKNVSVKSSISLPSDWLHVTGIFDAASGKVTTYLNGALVNTTTDALTGGLGTSWNTYLGQAAGNADDTTRYNTSSLNVAVSIHDFYLINAALEPEQVAILAQ